MCVLGSRTLNEYDDDDETQLLRKPFKIFKGFTNDTTFLNFIMKGHQNKISKEIRYGRSSKRDRVIVIFKITDDTLAYRGKRLFQNKR